MPVYVVLLGPPGAGRGTQAKIVSKELGLPHVSTGDIFRENFKNQTELGLLAKKFIDRGELVPDDVTIAMVRERLSRTDSLAGALLDGFPRTPVQAEASGTMLRDLGGKVDLVAYIKVPDDELVDRLMGRWMCKADGHIFHDKYKPPKQPGRCDLDGSELYKRDDDTVETVINRIGVFLEQTEPLIAYYRKQGVLAEIDGAQMIDRVTDDLLTAIAKEGF